MTPDELTKMAAVIQESTGKMADELDGLSDRLESIYRPTDAQLVANAAELIRAIGEMAQDQGR